MAAGVERVPRAGNRTESPYHHLNLKSPSTHFHLGLLNAEGEIRICRRNAKRAQSCDSVHAETGWRAPCRSTRSFIPRAGWAASLVMRFRVRALPHSRSRRQTLARHYRASPAFFPGPLLLFLCGGSAGIEIERAPFLPTERTAKKWLSVETPRRTA